MVSYRRGACFALRRSGVLILIVMDNGLLQAKKAEADYILSRLNPYCNG